MIYFEPRIKSKCAKVYAARLVSKQILLFLPTLPNFAVENVKLNSLNSTKMCEFRPGCVNACKMYTRDLRLTSQSLIQAVQLVHLGFYPTYAENYKKYRCSRNII